MAYCCNSGTYVMRGSSMPQSSSGYSSGLGIRVGVGSMFHPSMPFLDRAQQRCERPRRSSTRHKSKVEPSESSVAPALNTLLIEYGQSLLVRIGLAGCLRRSNSVESVEPIVSKVKVISHFTKSGLVFEARKAHKRTGFAGVYSTCTSGTATAGFR